MGVIGAEMGRLSFLFLSKRGEGICCSELWRLGGARRLPFVQMSKVAFNQSARSVQGQCSIILGSFLYASISQGLNVIGCILGAIVGAKWHWGPL